LIKPVVTKIIPKRDYGFMYENFVVATQHDVYLLLEKQNDQVACLKFNSSVFKYGYPNDEVGHPLMQYGLGFYGFFEVENSPWLLEVRNNNLSHPRDSNLLHANKKHYIAKFKDVTFEVIAKKYEEIELTANELFEIINQELIRLETT